MPAMATQVHRAALKQQNKRHNKIGHRTKGQVRSLSQGRLSFQSISRKAKHELNKQERRNQVKVVRADKREKTMNKKRSLGTVAQPPFLVCVLVLSPDINPRQVLSALTAADPDAMVTAGQQGTTHISCNRFKQRYTFVVPPIDDVYSILDAVKVCTTLLVVWPCCDRSEQILDDEQERLISSIKAQGLPTPVHTTLGFQDLPQKKKAAAQQNLLQEIRYYFPGEDKVKLHQLDKPGDALLCLRQIGAQKQRSLFYRDHRPHLLADRVQLQDDVDSASTCTLLVSGYMRGVQLSVDGLVHVPGWGDYQLTRLVCHGQDPHPLVVGGRVMAVEEKDTVMEADPSQQESLQSTREPGSEDHEIGHDDEDDDDEGLDDSFDVSDDDDDDGSKSIKSLTAVPMKLDKIPGAYSAYQAAWMIDNDAYKDDGSETDDSSGSERDEFEPTPALAVEGSEFGGDDEEDRLSTVSGSELSVLDDTYDEKVNYDNEMDEYSRILESRDDLEFPDEVDTPRDMPARERFHKYKPLESFRTSPWDLSADLPREYNKIFHIPKFEQFRKKVLSLGLEREGCMPGQYVTLHIKAVEKHLYLEHQKTGSPLVVFGLLPHEHKMSVVHLSIKSHPDGHKHPIKSKERLIFHVGFRRFVNQPIFSEHTTGDKQKLCRYFHPGTTVVASMYAPVCYPPASTLVFRERPSGRQELVATGSVYSINADRCVLKRIILSGHPFKIHKRSVVVRYMFFDRDDINWYKPIELRTKWGRKGKIKEALGTHGHMKCMFNGTLKSQDTILLNLYKRVFPKWTYNEHVSRCAPMYRPDTLEAIGCDSSEGEEEGGESKEQKDRELMPPPSKRPKKVQFS